VPAGPCSSGIGTVTTYAPKISICKCSLRIVRKEPPKASASRSQTAITYRENRTSESEAGATSRAAIRKQINDDVRFSDCIRAKNIPATYACLFLLSCCEGIGFVARSRRATQILAPAQRALIIPKLPPSVMRRVVKTRPVESTRCKWTGTEKSGCSRKEKIGSREKVGHEKAGQDEKAQDGYPGKDHLSVDIAGDELRRPVNTFGNSMLLALLPNARSGYHATYLPDPPLRRPP